MALFDILATVPPHYLAVSLIGAVASFFFLRSIFRAVFTPLQSIPGPFLARFTRLWYLYRVWKGDFEKVNIELHRKYGTSTNTSYRHLGTKSKSKCCADGT